MGALDLHADLVGLASAPAPMAPSAALREMAYRADAWTPQESDRLRVLLAADAALADIAAEMGRGRAAVAERVPLLGLRRHSDRPWTALDNAKSGRATRRERVVQSGENTGVSVSREEKHIQ